MTVALAATHHDPDARLYEQTARMLPLLREIYSHLTVTATHVTHAPTLELLRAAGATVEVGDARLPTGHMHLGLWRRMAVEQALHASDGATHLHFCDFDRVLHWAEYHPAELRATLAGLVRHDFTVLGRTPRAFASHPRVQRDTEALVNHTFGLACGLWWDVTAASRGLSRQAAAFITSVCRDDTIGSDCSWPLLLRRSKTLTLAYCVTEGLEFETLDRYPDEIAALGSPDAWIARLDADPRQWTYRLQLAHAEAASAIAYAAPDDQSFTYDNMK